MGAKKEKNKNLYVAFFLCKNKPAPLLSVILNRSLADAPSVSPPFHDTIKPRTDGGSTNSNYACSKSC